MSKRLGRFFESRNEAMNFVRENNIPIIEVKGINRKGDGKRIYRIIVADAVYKRWRFKMQKEDPKGLNKRSQNELNKG